MISRIIKEFKKVVKESNLNEYLKMRLSPWNDITLRIYGLPKIHKEGIPLRPIMNTIGSPTYMLAKYVVGILNPLVGNTHFVIKDSKHFVELITDDKYEPNDIIISFALFHYSPKFLLMN